MRLRTDSRLLTILRQTGAGFVLVLPVLQLVILKVVEARNVAPICLQPWQWNVLLVMSAEIAFYMWFVAGSYHARLALAASQLRVPGVWRMLCCSLGVLAIWTLAGMLVPVVVLHGQIFLWVGVISCEIGAGLLVVAFAGSRFQGLIFFSCFGVSSCLIWPEQVSSVSRQLIAILAVVTPFLIAWRLRVLVRGLRAGFYGVFFLSTAPGRLNMIEGWIVSPRAPKQAGPDRAWTAWWTTVFAERAGLRRRSVSRSPADAFRVALGPLYRRIEVWLWLILFAAPILLSFRSRALNIISMLFFMGMVSFNWAAIGVTLVVFRVRRLADFLENQSGEISDLALLPGLGNRRVQRRAMLLEVLVRPLVHYALAMGIVIGGWWLLVRLVGMPLQPILTLTLLSCGMLMMLATMSIGVLSRRLDRVGPWSNVLASLLMVCTGCVSFPAPLACAVGLGCGHDLMPSPPVWVNLLWLPVLAAMAACLVMWTAQLNRRDNLLCR